MKKSMREKAIERRNINKEHNSNFKAGYVPIEEERLHKTGLRGRKGNMAVCIVVLLFLLALINLIVSKCIRPSSGSSLVHFPANDGKELTDNDH